MKLEALLAALAFRIVEVGLREPRYDTVPATAEVTCSCECSCATFPVWPLIGVAIVSLVLNILQYWVRPSRVQLSHGSPTRQSRGVTVLPARG